MDTNLGWVAIIGGLIVAAFLMVAIIKILVSTIRNFIETCFDLIIDGGFFSKLYLPYSLLSGAVLFIAYIFNASELGDLLVQFRIGEFSGDYGILPIIGVALFSSVVPTVLYLWTVDVLKSGDKAAARRKGIRRSKGSYNTNVIEPGKYNEYMSLSGRMYGSGCFAYVTGITLVGIEIFRFPVVAGIIARLLD